MTYVLQCSYLNYIIYLYLAMLRNNKLLLVLTREC